MGQYSWKNAYSNLGIRLFDPDMFKEDEKHHGKEHIGTAQILYMLARTQSMFDYEGLPETIPALHAHLRNSVQILPKSFSNRSVSVVWEFRPITAGQTLTVPTIGKMAIAGKTELYDAPPMTRTKSRRPGRHSKISYMRS